MIPLDTKKRADEKQAARDEDARQLATGEITEQELRKRNGFFSAIDFSKWRMVAIGGKTIRRRKPPEDL